MENKESIRDNMVHEIFTIDTAEEQNKYNVIENQLDKLYGKTTALDEAIDCLTFLFN